MKIKERMKNAGFWISILSALFLILGAFGVEIGGAAADTVISAVCSILVVLGIISDPTAGKGYLDTAVDDGAVSIEPVTEDTVSDEE